jgi:hypothetical protein
MNKIKLSLSIEETQTKQYIISYQANRSIQC